jgi:hypothetical protein
VAIAAFFIKFNHPQGYGIYYEILGESKAGGKNS